MAVRVFEHTETNPPRVRLRVVDTAPLSRQDVRRTRHRWLVIGSISLAIPFLTAVVVLGVAR